MLIFVSPRCRCCVVKVFFRKSLLKCQLDKRKLALHFLLYNSTEELEWDLIGRK